jgi:Mn-dependent DtxR family transcriptional regulator
VVKKTGGVVNTRRGHLEDRILVALARAPAETITEVAKRAESSRPSTSGTIRRMRDKGLVVFEEGGWFLTEEGKVEVEGAMARNTLRRLRD